MEILFVVKLKKENLTNTWKGMASIKIQDKCALAGKKRKMLTLQTSQIIEKFLSTFPEKCEKMKWRSVLKCGSVKEILKKCINLHHTISNGNVVTRNQNIPTYTSVKSSGFFRIHEKLSTLQNNLISFCFRKIMWSTLWLKNYKLWCTKHLNYKIKKLVGIKNLLSRKKRISYVLGQMLCYITAHCNLPWTVLANFWKIMNDCLVVNFNSEFNSYVMCKLTWMIIIFVVLLTER